MIATATGIHATARDAINAQWNARNPQLDYVGMEHTLRALIRERATLDAVDESVAAYTGRGYELEAHS